MKIKIGSHVSFKKPNYLVGAIEESISYGANCAMIYLGAPQNTRRVDVEKYQIKEYFKNFANDIKPTDIIVHAPYIVNPASCEKYHFAQEFLIQEINRMNAFNAKFLVLHPGFYTKFPKEESIKTLIKTLKYIIDETKHVVISLETMSGKGTELGVTLEEIKFICEKVNSDRIGICLDTCHLWESGYNIEDVSSFISKLKFLKILPMVNVIHLNNSKNVMGARKDRHDNLKTGKIKLESLMEFALAKEFEQIPKILETPFIDKKPPYKAEIELIKTWKES